MSRVCMLLCLTVLLTCFPYISRAADMTFISVSIESVGRDGRAHKTVTADGSMSGGHMSGDMPPRIYRSEGRMPPEQLAELQNLLLKLVQESVPAPPPAQEAVPSSYRSISIAWDSERTQRSLSAGSDRFALPLLEQIYNLVARQRTGGW